MALFDKVLGWWIALELNGHTAFANGSNALKGMTKQVQFAFKRV